MNDNEKIYSWEYELAVILCFGLGVFILGMVGYFAGLGEPLV
jgi:preprotein translocase subunit Sss1